MTDPGGVLSGYAGRCRLGISEVRRGFVNAVFDPTKIARVFSVTGGAVQSIGKSG